MDDLTPRQRQICEAFARATDGRPPTIRELAGALGVTSTNGLHQHIRAIAKKGYLANARPGRWGAWLLTDKWWTEAIDEADVTVLLSLASVELLKVRGRIVARAGGKTVEIRIREVS